MTTGTALRLILYRRACLPDYILHHLLTRSGCSRTWVMMMVWRCYTGLRLPDDKLRRVKLDERRHLCMQTIAAIMSGVVRIERHTDILCMLDWVDSRQGGLDTFTTTSMVVFCAFTCWSNVFSLRVMLVVATTLKELPTIIASLHLAYFQIICRSELLTLLA